ncbi:unnamed protein product [Urochloa decumbens]|uniref:ABC transporter domain-containing protein n=1 Tax=Urochloa decumbens TaxID=240449 RepID=A0ABC9CS28_9POAL
MGRNNRKVVSASERFTSHALETLRSAAAMDPIKVLKNQPTSYLNAVKPKPSGAALLSKPRSRPVKALQPSSYLAGIDLPPSDDDDDDLRERAAKPRVLAPVDSNIPSSSRKEVKKEERRKLEAAARAAAAAREAATVLWDDPDAYIVTIGGRVLTAADASDANAKDIVVKDFDVSVGGMALFEGASLRVSHGRRYSLVGPNGKGKSTLLKLLNWRKLPVPRNTRVMLVVQEDNSKDHRPVIQVVLAADKELSKLLAQRDELEASGDAGIGNGRLSEAKQARPASTFSGGWIKRIALAGALFVQPTLLLLDEPTNHLDLQAVLWLEEYLSAQCKSTLIVVSHEEGFLNAVCDEIVHLQDKKLHAYRGNFDAFVGSYELKKVRVMKERERLVKAARKGGKKAPKKWHDYSVEFHFAEPTELPGRPSYGSLAQGSATKASSCLGLTLTLPWGSDKSVVQYLLESHPHLESKPGEARAMLGKFGLPKENHLTLIDKLSGGQKAHVVLASIALGEPHVLLLDEPTNNLDMQSIDALADALDEFAGGVVITSHDSRLITRVCADEQRSEVWVVQDGMVRTFDGSFAEYRDDLLEGIRKEMAMD